MYFETEIGPGFKFQNHILKHMIPSVHHSLKNLKCSHLVVGSIDTALDLGA